jgi:hypothetical protein
LLCAGMQRGASPGLFSAQEPARVLVGPQTAGAMCSARPEAAFWDTSCVCVCVCCGVCICV